MGVTPPRISEELREQMRKAVCAAHSPEVADKVIDRIWSTLEGDMQDRITTLIHAAQATVKSDGRNLGGLEGALKQLAGRETAATSTKQLREGPWHGRS